MKRFLMTTAIILTTAGAVHAQDSNDQLRAEVENYLAGTQYSVDVSSLTTEQLAQLHGAITSTDASGDVDSAVAAILNDSNVMYEERPMMIVIDDVEMPRDQLYLSVQSALVGTEYEGMAPTLTDEQLVQVYTAVNSSDDTSDMNSKLAAVFE